MNPYFQVGIVVFSGIFSWTISGWVTVNVVKYQMTQFMTEIAELKEWRKSFEERYNEHRIENMQEHERIRRDIPAQRGMD